MEKRRVYAGYTSEISRYNQPKKDLYYCVPVLAEVVILQGEPSSAEKVI